MISQLQQYCFSNYASNTSKIIGNSKRKLKNRILKSTSLDSDINKLTFKIRPKMKTKKNKCNTH